MSLPRVLAARLRSLFSSGRAEIRMDDELRFHVEMQIEDNMRLGMSPEEARYDAMRRFGGVASVKEQYRENRTFPVIESLLRDMHYALRGLRNSRGFTAVAIITLALGIGVNATVFTVTKAALFAGFPLVQNNDRILYLSSGRGCCLSYPDFEDWRARAGSFEGMAVVHGSGRTIGDAGGVAEIYDVTEVSADTFRLIGGKPMLGRDFTKSDDTPGAAPVAMLTYGLWDSRFAKDPHIVGRTIRMNGVPATVIGIMPKGFSFPQKQDLWVPLIPTPEVRKRDARGLWFAFGRLREGVTIGGARAEMEAIGRRLGDEYPLTNRGRNLIPQTQTFNQFFFFGNENTIYWSMWGAVGFVLLIACANLANLTLGRAMGRSREIALRIALGAPRGRIVRQLLIESLTLSGAGGMLGWWIAHWGVRAWALADRGPGRQSWRVLDYSMDYRVLGYLIAISIGTAILFGLAPARRLAKLDVNATLKDGGRGASGNGASGGRGKQLSALLVIVEMALAVVLLAGAGLMVRSFLNIYGADLGVKTANILTQGVNLPRIAYSGPESRIAFFERARTRLEAIPGVDSIAIADTIPTRYASMVPYELAGAASATGQGRPTVAALAISPDYFRTLGTGVLSGREFRDSDDGSGVPVAIVNERFANRYWPGENPLENRLRIFDGKMPGAWLTVVGLAPNIVQNDGTGQKFSPLVYLSYRQKPPANMEILARTRVRPAGLATAFGRELHAIDPELPAFRAVTLNERLEGNYWTTGLYGVLFVILAGIGLLLASVGLYAVIAHSVSRRMQEIGIRVAIGATSRDVRRLVFTQGMLPAGIGLAAGLAASFALSPVLKSFLVEVSPNDPATFSISSVTLILAAVLGCLIPARRATRVDPVVALRHD